jgi:prevent-host-death family protein
MIPDHGTICTMGDPLDTISISEFKATCLARLERVRRTGRRLLITRRGEPIAEVVPPASGLNAGRWLGTASGTGRIMGDLVEPAVPPEGWEATR